MEHVMTPSVETHVRMVPVHTGDVLNAHTEAFGVFSVPHTHTATHNTQQHQPNNTHNKSTATNTVTTHRKRRERCIPFRPKPIRTISASFGII